LASRRSRLSREWAGPPQPRRYAAVLDEIINARRT
jgi:hypothetical protein